MWSRSRIPVSPWCTLRRVASPNVLRVVITLSPSGLICIGPVVSSTCKGRPYTFYFPSAACHDTASGAIPAKAQTHYAYLVSYNPTLSEGTLRTVR